MSQPFLEVSGATKIYRQGLLAAVTTVALKEFSLCIDDRQPQIIGLAGESGSGKTTVANLVLGLIRATSGAVRYRGLDVTRLNRQQMDDYRREIQAIFQDPYEMFNPVYRVDHVLQMVVRKFSLANNRIDARRLMADSLDRVGLRPEETLGKFPHQLSGGQRQRMMIARALLVKPRLIVADEPVSMLDASLRGQILQIMQALKEEQGISFVYVTHDLSTAYQITDHLIVLHRGETVEQGVTEQVIRQPQHPYTQLLIRSIPLPDPRIRWGTTLTQGEMT